MDHMEPAHAVVVRKEPRLPRDLHSDLTSRPISRSVPSKKHDRCRKARQVQWCMEAL